MRFIWRQFSLYPMFILITSSTILQPLVDVKGNGAIRHIRLLYDIYETTTIPDTVQTSNSKSMIGKFWSTPHKTISHVVYPWTNIPRTPLTLIEQEQERRFNWISESSDHEPDYRDHRQLKQWIEYGDDGKYSKKSSSSTSSPLLLTPIRLKSKETIPIHYLIRGRPMFAEIDFVPRYIPQSTKEVIVTVTLPGHIRGRPWILGFHQEPFPMPTCRLCTNTDQSYTLPITIFLPDDGWCPEGRVQTIWKIEAIQQQPIHAVPIKNEPITSNQRPLDQTDMILAYGYDELGQLYIKNEKNSTKC